MRRVIAAIVATVTSLVLLLSYKTHSTGATPAATAAVSTNTGTTAATAAPSAVPTTSTGESSSAAAPASTTTTSQAATTTAPKTTAAPKVTTVAKTVTVTGDAADTRYGPVQVKVTVTDGKIASVQAVEYPSESRRDEEINSEAIPALNQEALAAGNAHIDVISGATYTSDGYTTSLQSALDKAGG